MPWKPHTKITWSGTFGEPSNPYEQWSFGLSVAHDDGTQLDIHAGTPADDAFGYAIPFLAAVSTNSVKMNQCKVANIGVDGHYVGAPVIHNETPGVGPGQALYPPQIALAVSLWSGPDTFPKTHGRFYIPGPKNAMEVGSGVANDSSVATTLAACKTLIDALNGDFISSSGHVVVASQKGAGANVIVAQIRLGHAFDTIRSRRRKIKELYALQSL